jgi:hypothetical protein
MKYVDIPFFAMLSNLDAFVKSPQIVMPDLIRYPEHIELTGFQPTNDVGSLSPE